jgi:hypothetical protein
MKTVKNSFTDIVDVTTSWLENVLLEQKADSITDIFSTDISLIIKAEVALD